MYFFQVKTSIEPKLKRCVPPQYFLWVFDCKGTLHISRHKSTGLCVIHTVWLSSTLQILLSYRPLAAITVLKTTESVLWTRTQALYCVVLMGGSPYVMRYVQQTGGTSECADMNTCNVFQLLFFFCRD